MANSKTQLMAQFYEQCQDKGYTDMRDDRQSLKAKVIATDLGLRYGNIVEFYEKAAQCYHQVQAEKAEEAERLRIQNQKEQAERARRAVDGVLLVTVSGNKETLKVFLRPDHTIYCTVNDGGKIEGIPSVTVHKGGSLQYTYHPSETVFTGASSGGIMMGGTHQTEAHYTERVTKSGKGYIQVGIGGAEVSVTWITMSDYTRECFKRDAQFKALVSNGRIRCTKDSEMANMLTHSALMGGGNIYTQMSQLTMAADEKRLPYETCKEIANLLGRVIHGNFPPTDEEIYDCAKNLAESKTSAQLLSAIEMFRDISDYKDASTQIKSVQIKYEEVLQEEKEQAILDREARSRCTKRITLIAIVILVTLTAAVFIRASITKNNAYRNAVAQMDAGNYGEAISAFEALGEYKDSISKISECEIGIVEVKYKEALTLMDEGKYVAASAKFRELGRYKDSFNKIRECAMLEEKPAYDAAVALEESGEIARAAIAFAKLTAYPDSKKHSLELWNKFAVRDTICDAYRFTLGLKEDGTVIATGNKNIKRNWSLDHAERKTDITAVTAGQHHYILLRENGTVSTGGVVGDDYGTKHFALGKWSDIVAISASNYTSMGLKYDGTVVAGASYRDIDVSDWTDIIAISAGSQHIVGLKADGTVVAKYVGKNENKYGSCCNVSGWKDVVAISAGGNFTLGLTTNGEVLFAGTNEYVTQECCGWNDIVSISAGVNHAVGLRSDGTVVAVGSQYDGKCDVSGWTDIVAVSAEYHTVGLRADGTVVVVGNNDDGECYVDGWKNIRIPN